MSSLHMILPVKPTPKARPRLGKGRTYTPLKTLRAEQEIKILALKALPKGFKPLDSAIGLKVSFHIRRPKSVPRGREFVTTRPDLDNYLKLVMDSLNGVVWKDDGQICQLTAEKVYSTIDSIELDVITMSPGSLG